MSLSKPQVIFEDSYGKRWENYSQALVATALQNETYLDSYKLELIVKIITDNFYLREKKHETE